MPTPSLPVDLRAETCSEAKTYPKITTLPVSLLIEALGTPAQDDILDLSKGLSEFQVTQTPRLEAWGDGEDVRIRQTTWELSAACRFTTWSEDEDGEDRVTNNYLWHKDAEF